LRTALRIIYQTTRELIAKKQFEKLDKEILCQDFSNLNSDLLLGILTATSPGKSFLRSRKSLYKATKRLLKQRGQFERGILDGLK